MSFEKEVKERWGNTEAQALVKKLQDYITSNYYTCTDEIIAGLGQMYLADKRFKSNIDEYADGTAEYASKAIAIYTKRQTN
ncbi:MAG: TipAS antibiotic-recognition domain-containing protein [Eubacterium sp.]|nr:TipAS antibiotic-recognition domain-containing protein [Eubacterium sp.]